MTVRNYRGFPSLQEVECWGGDLEAEVRLLTLKMYDVSDNAVVAFVNIYENRCVAYGEFASCVINTPDAKRSKLRVLAADLVENQTRVYGCIANVLRDTEADKITWTVSVRMNRKFSYFQYLFFERKESFLPVIICFKNSQLYT